MKNVLAGMGVATVAGVIMLSQTAFAATQPPKNSSQNHTRPVIERTVKNINHAQVKKTKKVTKNKKVGSKKVTPIKKS